MCQMLLGPVLGAVLAAAACTAEGSAALAQNFPTKPVTLIVPWPAGGTTDIAMRALAAATEKHLGQSIVIENRPGVSGTLGPMQMAATAKPDGHTVAQIPLSLFRVALSTNTMLDPSKDLTYVIGLTGYTFGVVVRSDAPWATFRDLLADAKVRPGKINYGSPGGRTTPHTTMVQIARQQGINWIHVREAPRRRMRSSAVMSMRPRMEPPGVPWSTPEHCDCWSPGALAAPRTGRPCRH
jgi:tripartite-type tricarboxylate transporter receptor subunit TctC